MTDPVWAGHGQQLYQCDAAELLASLPGSSADSVVTDPPYSLAFMGREWDRFTPAGFQAWCGEWAAECLRVLKPGGHLVAFGGTRTYHRLTCALEDAGFEIRDSLAWLYGSGFPKSRDVGKAIDAEAGAAREAAGPNRWEGRNPRADHSRQGVTFADDAYVRPADPPATTPATDAAAAWEGWGTALKPSHEPVILARKPAGQDVTATATDVTPGSPPGEAAPAVYPGGHEPIVLARKPLAGTVAGNVLAYGTGALNVEGCRVAHNEPDGKPAVGQGGARRGGIMGEHPETLRARETTAASTDGRWPPNVLLTHAAGCEPAGTVTVRGAAPREGRGSRPGGFADVGAGRGDPLPNGPSYGDEQVDAWECAPGCPVAEIDRQSGTTRSSGGSGERSGRDGRGGGFTQTVGHNAGGLGDEGGASRFYPVLDWTPAELEFAFAYTAKAAAAERPGKVGADDEAHPTVKPLALCLWLARLVTPPGGRIVDPFAGTGPVLEAAAMLGMSGVGCDNWQVAVDSAVLRLSDIGGRDRKIRARRPRVRAGDTLW